MACSHLAHLQSIIHIAARLIFKLKPLMPLLTPNKVQSPSHDLKDNRGSGSPATSLVLTSKLSHLLILASLLFLDSANHVSCQPCFNLKCFILTVLYAWNIFSPDSPDIQMPEIFFPQILHFFYVVVDTPLYQRCLSWLPYVKQQHSTTAF